MINISSIMAPPLTGASSTSKKGNENLSTTDFYKLLAAQIQYQNPFDDSGSGSSGSSGSTSYLTDLSIMSATTAIQEMTRVENYSMSTAMTGKKVSFISTSTSTSGKISLDSKNGTVTAVDLTAEKPRLYITSDDGKEGQWVEYNAVTNVYSNDVSFENQSSSLPLSSEQENDSGITANEVQSTPNSTL